MANAGAGTYNGSLKLYPHPETQSVFVARKPHQAVYLTNRYEFCIKIKQTDINFPLKSNTFQSCKNLL